MLKQNNSFDSIFYQKIGDENIGIASYSQGRTGEIRAVTEYDSSDRHKVLFMSNALYAYLTKMRGGYDIFKVSVPWFMAAWMLYQL